MHNEHKKKLEAERQTLLAALGTLGKYNSENNTWEATAETADPSEADPNSSADRFENYEEASATMKPLASRLLQIERALAAIENDAYGKCRVCGGAIEAARLNANPAAETCMEHLEE